MADNNKAKLDDDMYRYEIRYSDNRVLMGVGTLEHCLKVREAQIGTDFSFQMSYLGKRSDLLGIYG